MASGFPVFFRLVKKSFLPPKDSFAPLTLKRALVMSGMAPAIFLGQLAHWLGFALDEVFFRDYHNVKVKEPLFVMGIPRSGTTHLHRLLTHDTDNFTTMKTWEMVIAPSITERKIILGLAAVDEKLGGHGRKLLLALDERAFRSVRKIHKVSLFEAEEDDLVLFPIFGSLFLFFPFPFPEELWHLVRFDTECSPEERKKSMTFYERCVKKHLYVHGQDKHFLSKNPQLSPKTDSILEYFPDARSVCNVRNPFQAIPSLMSFLSFSFERFGNNRQGNKFRDVVLDIADAWYRMPMERLPKWPQAQHDFLTYDELTRNPREVIEALYAKFGYTLSPAFQAYLKKEEEKAKNYKSEHKYSLDLIDMTPEQLYQAFKDVFDRFQFDTRYDGVDASQKA